jgi:hypothetical protein
MQRNLQRPAELKGFRQGLIFFQNLTSAILPQLPLLTTAGVKLKAFPAVFGGQAAFVLQCTFQHAAIRTCAQGGGRLPV